MADFRMPSLGADMENGTLALWKVKPGDKVQRGDIIADVETAKGIIEIECFEDGIIDQLLIEAGQTVPVGEVIARIRAEGEPVPIASNQPVVEEKSAAVPSTRAPQPAPQAVSVDQTIAIPSERVRISPLARKLASDLGVDVRTVIATGPAGAIIKADIERAVQMKKVAAVKPEVIVVKEPEIRPPVEAIQPPPAPPAAEEKRPVDFQLAMRQAIAAAMSRSNRDIPHYYLEMHIDMSRALHWLEEENLKRSIKDRLLPVVLLLKAVARALVDVPELNGYWVEDHLQTSEAINIGFAISLRQGGLVTPAIHNVDLKSWDELREAVSDLIVRTRAGRLRSSEMTDSTITVTSLGDRGVEKVFGVIYPPQVALVGFGRVTDQPWIENNMIGIRPVLVASLAGDHRATDGHRGALFLEALNRSLQEVDKL